MNISFCKDYSKYTPLSRWHHKLMNISFCKDYSKYTPLLKKNKRRHLWGICLASCKTIFRNYFAKTFPKIDLYLNSSMPMALEKLQDIRLSSDKIKGLILGICFRIPLLNFLSVYNIFIQLTKFG